VTFPSGSRLASLEKRYGKVFTNQKQLDKTFCVKDNSLLAKYGAGYLVGRFSRIGVFFGEDAVSTGDEIKTVCMSKCADNPICDAVHIYNLRDLEEDAAVAPGTFPDGTDWTCIFVNADLGPAFLTDTGIDAIDGYAYISAVLIKKNKTFRDSSEAVCNIPSGYTTLGPGVSVPSFNLALGCAIGDPNLKDSPLCPVFMTNDFMEHVFPAANCVGEAAVAKAQNRTAYGPAVEACLKCIDGLVRQVPCDIMAANVCTANSEFNYLDKCAAKCPDECRAKLQTSILCTAGSPYTSSDGKGCINKAFDDGRTPDFTCPAYKVIDSSSKSKSGKGSKAYHLLRSQD